jgi:hypothetical protein
MLRRNDWESSTCTASLNSIRVADDKAHTESELIPDAPIKGNIIVGWDQQLRRRPVGRPLVVLFSR